MSTVAATPAPVGVVRRALTARRLHRLVRGAQFTGLLVAFLLLLWVTPLAGTIDDEFRLTPPPGEDPTLLLTMGGADSGSEGTRPGEARSASPAEGEEGGPAGPSEGGTGGGPGGGGTGGPGPDASPPTTAAPGAPTAGTPRPAEPGGSERAPTDTPTSDPNPSAPSGATDAARVAAMLAAGLGHLDAAYSAAEQRCLADELAGAHDPATLATMATATSPAGLGTVLTTLAGHLGACFPLQTAVLASLLEGATPAPVASCLAPEIAAHITWDPLLVLELSPTDPTANDVLAGAAAAASALCPLG